MLKFGRFVYIFVYVLRKTLIFKVYCGERGIRTPGTSRYDGFQDRCNRPLYHLSLQDDQLGFLKRLQRYDYFFFLPNIYETFFDFSLKKWLYVCL